MEQDEEPPEEGSFLKWFIGLCTKSNFLISDSQERERYRNPPYNERIINWIDWRDEVRRKKE